MVKTYIPKKGDIIVLEFDPQSGREQKGTRPALVLSPATYNAVVGLAICCPITSKAKGYPFEVDLPAHGKTKGVILADHVKSLDYHVRQARFCESVSQATLDEVEAKLKALLFAGE